MDTINREARKTSGKGLGFQTTRAVQRLLRLMKAHNRKPVYCATEFYEDSLTLISEQGDVKIGLEENKNYSTGLSFNSEPVKNTLVAFADQYIQSFSDTKSIDFSMFCLAKLADESISNHLISTWLPNFKITTNKQTNFSILKKLVSNENLTTDELTIAKNIFIQEYLNQYTIYSDKEKKIPSRVGGHYSILSAWTDEVFYDFIKNIKFIFNDIDDDAFEDDVLNDIKDCEYYNHNHYGRENIILSSLESLFNKRQQESRDFSRFVSASDVKVIYLEIANNSEEFKPIDPAWESFESIDTTDQRNLLEKYNDVCTDVSDKKISRLSLSATNSRKNESIFGHEYVSLRCQLYVWCSDYIEKHCKSEYYLIDTLDYHLDEMIEICYNKVINLKSTYRIRINDKENIRGIILTLLDDCYIAYDE